MPHTMFLLFNHRLTADQEEDARVSLGIENIIAMPDELQQIWSKIPPDLPEIYHLLEPVCDWLAAEASPIDFVLIQGDYGACWLMVKYAFEKKLVPVYSTTLRQVSEIEQKDGSIRMDRKIKHVMFRKYEKV